jgi:hypothetical protein
MAARHHISSGKIQQKSDYSELKFEVPKVKVSLAQCRWLRRVVGHLLLHIRQRTRIAVMVISQNNLLAF